MSQIAEMLRFLRKQEGLTQEELANKTGLSRSRINNYENGIREPDFETAELFADFFNVDMDTLTGRKIPVTTKGDGQEEKYEEIRQIFDALNLENAESLRDYALDLLRRQKSQDVQ